MTVGWAMLLVGVIAGAALGVAIMALVQARAQSETKVDFPPCRVEHVDFPGTVRLSAADTLALLEARDSAPALVEAPELPPISRAIVKRGCEIPELDADDEPTARYSRVPDQQAALLELAEAC
jgi:hypothetical protein